MRVPDAYPVVAQYKSTRPGLLVLAPDGARRGSVGLLAADPAGSLRRAVDYLTRARDADAPLPDDHPFAEEKGFTAKEWKAFEEKYPKRKDP